MALAAPGLQKSLAIGPADVCLFRVHIVSQEIVACAFADASGRACCPLYTLVESQDRVPFVSVSLVWAWVLRAAFVKSKNQCACFLTKTKDQNQQPDLFVASESSIHARLFNFAQAFAWNLRVSNMRAKRAESIHECA